MVDLVTQEQFRQDWHDYQRFTTIGPDPTCDYIVDGVDDDVQIQAAIDDATIYAEHTKCDIYFKPYAYQCANPITITIPDTDSIRSLHLFGAGEESRLVFAGSNGILLKKLENAAKLGSLYIEKMSFYGPGGATAYKGISGHDDLANYPSWLVFRDLRLHEWGTGIELMPTITVPQAAPYCGSFENIFIRDVNVGFKIDGAGNYLQNIKCYNPVGANSVGIHLPGTTATRGMADVINCDGSSFETGILVECGGNTIKNFYHEGNPGTTVGININRSSGYACNTVINPHMATPLYIGKGGNNTHSTEVYGLTTYHAGETDIRVPLYIGANAYGVYVQTNGKYRTMNIQENNGTNVNIVRSLQRADTAVQDAQVGDRIWQTTPIAGASPGWVCTVAGSPGTWAAMPILGIENRGTGTIGNGTQTSGNIAHGLGGAPTGVIVSGSTTDTDCLYLSSKDATNIVINAADGNVGGDRTIYWYAWI